MAKKKARKSNGCCAPDDDGDESLVEGLTPEQISVLAQRVYDLLLEELRIERERHGELGSRYGI